MFEESFMRPLDDWLLTEGEIRPLALDVSETDEALVMEASLPGIRPEDVDISIVGRTLTIKGEVKHEEEKEEKGKYHYRERHYSSYQRAITLPAEVNADAAEALLENGELKLMLPKLEETKPKRIEVK
jgi:HSP20 family protein